MTAQRRQNILQITYITSPTQTPIKPQWSSPTQTPIKPQWSRYAILKHTYRLDVMHAGDTNKATSTETVLSLNALTLSPTASQLTIIPRQRTT